MRVGDTIDIGWSWTSRPALWAGHYFRKFQLDWSTPVGLTRVRLDLPAGTPLSVYRYRGAPPAEFRRAAGRDIRQWISIDPDPIVEDEGTPQWHLPWRRVAVSTMSEWKGVVDWALPLYAAADRFPAQLQDEAALIERGAGLPS